MTISGLSPQRCNCKAGWRKLLIYKRKSINLAGFITATTIIIALNIKNITTKAISAHHSSDKRLTVHQYFTTPLLQVWWQRQKKPKKGAYGQRGEFRTQSSFNFTSGRKNCKPVPHTHRHNLSRVCNIVGCRQTWILQLILLTMYLPFIFWIHLFNCWYNDLCKIEDYLASVWWLLLLAFPELVSVKLAWPRVRKATVMRLRLRK